MLSLRQQLVCGCVINRSRGHFVCAARVLMVAMTSVCGLAVSVPALGQPLAAKPSQQQGMTETELDQLIAARIYRTAVLDLRAAENPGTADFALAQASLQYAKVFAPQSPELVRAMISAAYAANDEATVQELTKDLVRLDTSDTVAQLRLISSRIRSLQTVDQRTAAYDRLLGTDGDKLDPSLRSRLALDAALLAREIGKDQVFVDRLRQAVQLDGSNKDAALLAMSFAGQQPLDVRARFELLSNLLLSDPLDPAVHMQMRDELAQGGAFAQAERFHLIAMRISGTGEGLSEQLDGLCLKFRNAGPSATLTELNKILAVARDQQRKALDASGTGSIGDLRSPENVRLPIELEELRVASAMAANNAEAASIAMADLVASHTERSELLRDPIRRGEMSEAEALDAASQHDIEAAAWKLLSGYETTTTLQGLDALIESIPNKGEDIRVPTLRTLAAYAAGNDAQVIESTQGVTADEPYLAIPRALALAKDKGKVREAAQLLRDIERVMPLTAMGALAGHKATTLDMTSSHTEAATLGSLARGIPTWVDAMSQRPGVFQSLSVEHDRQRASPRDVVALNARIKNVSSVPLALGDAKTIGSRIALTPRLEVSPPELALLLQGEVIELDRKLRLMPGEELNVSVQRPEAGLLSWVIGTGSASPTRLRYRALQGFGYDINGILAPGPGGVDTTTGTLEREGLAFARLSMKDLAEKVRTAYASELPDMFVAARAVLVCDEIERRKANGGVITSPAAVPAGADVTELVTALAESYATWSAQHRALALTELPFAGDVPMMSVFDAAASLEVEPSVLPLVVLTRVVDASNPALATAEGSASNHARNIAALQRKRLEGGGQTLAGRGLLVTAAPAGTTRMPPEPVPVRLTPAGTPSPDLILPEGEAQPSLLEKDLTAPGTTLPPTKDPAPQPTEQRTPPEQAPPRTP